MLLKVAWGISVVPVFMGGGSGRLMNSPDEILTRWRLALMATMTGNGNADTLAQFAVVVGAPGDVGRDLGQGD
jgi:hypothetical protein